MRTHRPFLLGALAAAALLASQASLAFVSVGVSINIAPPALPVYEQPPMPADGYIWSPGYWAYSDDTGYYWVPGTWVEPPQPGYLWTPGYWGWNDGAYLWHEGYWGTEVGFYGGVNYGFGYGGVGFEGGYWQGGRLFYNRSVNNIPTSVHITNVYNKTVINNVTVNRVSFNGGNGGIQARPTQQQLSAERAPHLMPVSAQMQHQQAAHNNPDLRDAVNHGHPAVAATARPGEFAGRDVIAAHGASNEPHAVTGPAHNGEGASHPTSFNRPETPANTHVNTPATAPRAPSPQFDRSPGSGGEHPQAPSAHNNNAPADVPHSAAEHAQQIAHPAVHEQRAPGGGGGGHPNAGGGGGGHPGAGGGGHPGGERGGGPQGNGRDDHH